MKLIENLAKYKHQNCYFENAEGEWVSVSVYKINTSVEILNQVSKTPHKYCEKNKNSPRLKVVQGKHFYFSIINEHPQVVDRSKVSEDENHLHDRRVEYVRDELSRTIKDRLWQTELRSDADGIQPDVWGLVPNCVESWPRKLVNVTEAVYPWNIMVEVICKGPPDKEKMKKLLGYSVAKRDAFVLFDIIVNEDEKYQSPYLRYDPEQQSFKSKWYMWRGQMYLDGILRNDLMDYRAFRMEVCSIQRKNNFVQGLWNPRLEKLFSSPISALFQECARGHI